ncbi:Anaphase-promoting complex subunit 2 [Zostera marina]|uniref:Anaphase-promoting complex subunit 2 n=1 Tax=Zostera marina TaxID=29655 RepID=A0A0K9PJV5_ZOSMR|nr:Anaphase-promoting complex subunit 2 [Zostera marina]
MDLSALQSVGDDFIDDILQSWTGFCDCTHFLLHDSTSIDVNPMVEIQFASFVHTLCKHNFNGLLQDYFLQALEDAFNRNAISKLWRDFDNFYENNVLKKEKDNLCEDILQRTLKEISLHKAYHEKCIHSLVCFLQQHAQKNSERYIFDTDGSSILSKYQLMVSSLLLSSLPCHFPDVLRSYFDQKLEYLSKLMDTQCEEEDGGKFNDQNPVLLDSSDVGKGYDQSFISKNYNLVTNIGRVVDDLRNLGFSSLAEDAYASAIFFLLKTRVHNLAGDDYHIPVLKSIKEWIQAIPLQFLSDLLAYLGDIPESATDLCGLQSPLASLPSSVPGIIMSEGLVRWKLRLEYFAYETLQDLRIGKLFEIIVDYPDSCPAIDDLKQCLHYTGQHSKLVNSFVSSLRYRLLTACASTNDILDQYISTIKALRTVDPTGVFLETVAEPVRDYLRGRKDTIKCIVTMLTDGSGGNPSGPRTNGDSLLEELNRDPENIESVDYEDDFDISIKQAWFNAESWEPNHVAAGSSKGSSRRKFDILGMMIAIIGSKDQLVNEYRVMLAEKLLNKFDYDINSEIRTVELLKIHFGESNMQNCEIMLNDLIESKRTNTNIKASLCEPSQSENGNVSLDILDATIMSMNFWPPVQVESFNMPAAMDAVLTDYANRFHEIKRPRKLSWLKNHGTVKLELQFEGRTLQFSVAPIHAVIIMKFQEQMSWSSNDIADSIGIPVDILNKRITFWINKGIIAESHAAGIESNNHVFTVIERTDNIDLNDITHGDCEDLLANEDEHESLTSVEDLLKKEMGVYEKFITGMLTNFGTMTLDKIHNTLKIFCVAEPAYDKTLQQLQTFLSFLVSEEKLDFKGNLYLLKK